MPTLLTLNTPRSDDGKLVLIAAGEIDLSNVDMFTHALTAAIAETAGSDEKLTVDLSTVKYLDSAAVNVLFHHAEQIRLIVHPFLIRIFTVTGLNELATVEVAPPE
ncbi:STAS domain-containing protein [Candidatus Mycobacterium methanotrophicum]|uniref:STAS domain-containing protein n=1 Tax=Candidatus Mycobacterium methanotrophicum TaxID=2943498 RepID=A0ABY4QG34_9MYCO|nr:STAS domain-containing protein [Candidatus Mycobacterium methanotrophicum]UQX09957.1 STAS domain-containing protein [Candidatus Mycobacterium methanotrophicum]